MDETAVLNAGVSTGADSGANTGQGEGVSSGTSQAGGEGSYQPDTEQQLQPSDGQDIRQTEGESEGDGRLLPQSLKKHFAELKASNPQLAKELRGIFFANQAYRQTFPTPQEAQKAKEFYDLVGGEQGWQAVESERQGWNQIDADFANGDPKVIDSVIQEFPEGFAKLVPHVLDKYAASDKEGYNHLAGRIVFNTIRNSGAIDALKSLLQVKDAAPVAQQILEWISGVEELALRQPERKIDPERKKLQEERAQFEKERESTFQQGLQNEFVSKVMAPGIEKELSAHLSKRGLDIKKLQTSDPDSYAILVQNIDARIGKALNADREFISRRDALLATRDKSRILSFYKSRVERLMPDAVSKVYAAFYKLGGGKTAESAKRAETNAARPNLGQGNTASQRMSGQPKPEDIDYSRTSRDMIWQNKAYLKGRKEQVTW